MTAVENVDTRREWSLEEITDLELCASIGDSAADIAESWATETEVRAKASELGIKFERYEQVRGFERDGESS
jgi:hypothetical protein